VSALNLAVWVERTLHELDRQINEAYVNGIDHSRLIVVKEELTHFLAEIRQNVLYMAGLYDAYGTLPDEWSLRAAIDRFGYEQIDQLFGNELYNILAEGMGI